MDDRRRSASGDSIGFVGVEMIGRATLRGLDLIDRADDSTVRPDLDAFMLLASKWEYVTCCHGTLLYLAHAARRLTA